MQELLKVKESKSHDLDNKQLQYQIHDFEKGQNEVDLPDLKTIFPRFRK